jgi:hypothetical protein
LVDAGGLLSSNAKSAGGINILTSISGCHAQKKPVEAFSIEVLAERLKKD